MRSLWPLGSINKILVLLLIIYSASTARGQKGNSDFFKNRDFNQYFAADLYAPTNRVALGAALGTYEYDIARQPRGVVALSEPVLGIQLPIYYHNSEKSKFSISIPISFSVLFDFTEFRTAPIVNTDYRFAPIEFNYSRLLNNNLIRNIGVKLIPLFHESTHLGDEITIARVYVSIPTTRINVSYETIELSLLINDSYGKIIKNHQFGIRKRDITRLIHLKWEAT